MSQLINGICLFRVVVFNFKHFNSLPQEILLQEFDGIIRQFSEENVLGVSSGDVERAP